MNRGNIDPDKLLKDIVKYFSTRDNFRKLIKPIIIKKDIEGKFDSTEILNRLAYTIIDQQRDVSSIVIPIWVNLMYKNINPEFLSKSEDAIELVQAMFKAYGHQNYHTKSDFKLMGKGGASRTDAFIQVYEEYSSDQFLKLIMENSRRIEIIFQELLKLKYVSLKSASFFLRDVEGLEYDVLPIDVNVAYSLQYTGLFFFDELDRDVIPVSKRTRLVEYSRISDKIRQICSELDHNPHEINRYLFLLGAEFCQSLNCDNCFVRDNCYFNSLSENQKEVFVKQIKSD